jgi:hypothetical protein
MGDGLKAITITLTLVLAMRVSTLAIGAQGEIIDRVLAVVEGEIITQSDVDAAIALGLLDAPASSGAGDPRDVVLQRLIERELTLREVRRYLPPEPSEVAVNAALGAIREPFDSPGEFGRALARYGLDERQLTERVRDDLRIDAYLDERFASVAQPTGEEVSAYYFANLAAFTRDGRLVPLDAVLETIRARLEAERRNAIIAEWRTGLRRRAEVIELEEGDGNRGFRD